MITKKAIVLFMVSIMMLGVVGCNNSVEQVDNKVTSSTTLTGNNAEDNQIEETTVEENIEDDIEE